MIRETWTHTGTSQRAVEGFSGFAGVAKHLNETFGSQVSRQLVWTWYSRRTTTSFPEKQTVSAGGRDLCLFNLEDVVNWYRVYRPSA
jgi:hypothetical protein